MDPLGAIGSFAFRQWHRRFYLVVVAATVLWVSARPRNWPRTVRNVLARQILFTGVEATRFISYIALVVGFTIVVQAQIWFARVGQTQLIGPILVMVLIRELAPLLANLVVIGRSGNAIAAELANMKVSRELHALDAQGLDPLTYLVMPRVLGMVVSVFCLTVVFVTMSLVSGYAAGLVFGAKVGSPVAFLQTVTAAITPADICSWLAKTIAPALLSATISCTEGLSVEQAVTEVPRAATRSLERSLVTLFVTSAVVSVLSYL